MVNSCLVTVRIDTVMLMRVSVSVWNLQYGKQWVCGSVDRYSGVDEG
jgi:hypothetical protein